MRFGVREICDVCLRAKASQKLGSRQFYKNDPVLYFDTLKTSSLEGAATTVYAQGGKGNPRLIAWEGEKTLTFTFEDALLSPESFAILSGAGLIDATTEVPIYVHQTSNVKVNAQNKIVLNEIICWNGIATSSTVAVEDYHNDGADIFCMILDEDGQVAAEPCVPSKVEYTSENKTEITCYADGKAETSELKEGQWVLVDYYVKKVSGAMAIEITANSFGGNYYLEGSTLFRRESDGVDLPAEIIIPNGKIQSNFTFTMASTGDPSTFTFTMDAFPDYTKFNKENKVLAVIQIIDESKSGEEGVRKACGEDQGE